MSWVIPRVIFCDVVTKEDLKGGGGGGLEHRSIIGEIRRFWGFLFDSGGFVASDGGEEGKKRRKNWEYSLRRWIYLIRCWG